MTRRALCIGINDYPGTNSDLSGCGDDARDWAAELSARGFAVETLLDAQATKASIAALMRDVVATTGYRQTSVITYSGHGTWVPDEDGDEPDRRDEALCPWDIMDGQLLLDDDLAEIFSEKRFGARIVFISDSCHSGTVQRLFLDPDRLRKIRFLPPATFLSGRAMKRAETAYQLAPGPIAKRQRADDVVLLSGCRDDQYSYDAYIRGRYNGAFTRTALDTLGTRLSYAAWMSRIRGHLPSDDYPQTPQLSAQTYMKAWEALA